MKRNYIIGFLICAVLFVALLYKTSNNNISIEKRIASIPQKDRVVIEDFFKFLYAQGCFVDVIYGDKPMASVDYNVYYTINVSKDETYKKNLSTR